VWSAQPGQACRTSSGRKRLVRSPQASARRTSSTNLLITTSVTSTGRTAQPRPTLTGRRQMSVGWSGRVSGPNMGSARQPRPPMSSVVMTVVRPDIRDGPVSHRWREIRGLQYPSGLGATSLVWMLYLSQQLTGDQRTRMVWTEDARACFQHGLEFASGLRTAPLA
jgi:hypothetical protein